MVHKKYIKRNGNVFGPYLYENYRENGVTKTRYLGIGKKGRKLRFSSNFLLILSIVLLIIFSFLSFSSFEDEGFGFSSFRGSLFSENFLNVFVEIIGTDGLVIEIFEDELFVCENRALEYFFNISDANGARDISRRDMELTIPFFLSCTP